MDVDGGYQKINDWDKRGVISRFDFGPICLGRFLEPEECIGIRFREGAMLTLEDLGALEKSVEGEADIYFTAKGMLFTPKGAYWRK